jgi:hypothetical protein
LNKNQWRLKSNQRVGTFQNRNFGIWFIYLKFKQGLKPNKNKSTQGLEI